MTIKPRLSIFMLTYNHEHFIRQALDSIYAQNFEETFEVVIGDDASQDRTLKIIEEYQKKYKNIVLLTHSKNLGIGANFYRTYERCSGDYLAILEGDDYWTDKNKLKIQYEFLEANPNYMACFHNVICCGHREGEAFLDDQEMKSEYELKDFIHQNVVPTCSILMRKKILSPPLFFKEFSLTDWPLHMLLSQKGKYFYMAKTMAAYRYHDEGAWSQKSLFYRQARTLKMFLAMKKYFGSPWKKEFNRVLVQKYFRSFYLKIFPSCYSEPLYYRYILKILKEKIIGRQDKLASKEDI